MNLPHDEITHDEYQIYCTMKLHLTMKSPTINLSHDEIPHDEFIARWKLLTMNLSHDEFIARCLPTMNLSHDEITHDEIIADEFTTMNRHPNIPANTVHEFHMKFI